ncbi:MAG: hypothetical protein KA787_02420, partial [Bacteroidia bacterium]|nr:hypothetical protein [Bacteroidia bacterium]
DLPGNWPDYVFDPGYSLMSLKEVERYVSENRKLPGLPSARTIKSEGLDVGFMQAKMLEKMEELVLYVILLEKKVSSLEEQLVADRK